MNQHTINTIKLQAARIDILVNRADDATEPEDLDKILTELSNVAHILRSLVEVTE